MIQLHMCVRTCVCCLCSYVCVFIQGSCCLAEHDPAAYVCLHVCVCVCAVCVLMCVCLYKVAYVQL